MKISRNWATAHSLVFEGWPWSCHGAGGCAFRRLMFYSGLILRLKVHRKSNLPPSWTCFILSSFCHVLWLCCAVLSRSVISDSLPPHGL